MANIEYYQNLCDETLQSSEIKERNRVWDRIDAADKCRWQLPSGLTSIGVRPVKSTKIHDSLASATRSLSTIVPKIDVLPQGPDSGEYRRCEMIETSLEWHLMLANFRGEKDTPISDSVYYAMKYQAVAMQTVYLPFELKGNNKRIKALKRTGDFAVKVHDPRNVYPIYDNYGLSACFLAVKMKAERAINEYGMNGELDKLKAELAGKDEQETTYNLKNTNVVVVDYADYDNRVVWVCLGDTLAGVSGTPHVIRNEPHELPFLPWIYKEGRDPIMKAIVESGQWDNYQVVNSVRQYLVCGSAAHPAYKSQTHDGEAPDINFDEGFSTAALEVGEDIQPFPPRLLDPHLTEIIGMLGDEIHQSTIARVLSAIESYANSPFSTVNVMLQTAMSSLDPSKKIAEAAWRDALYQMLCWIKKSGIPLTAYRRADKQSREKEPVLSRGAQITVTPEEGNLDLNIVSFDPDELYLTFELQPDIAGDRQARLNIATIEVERLGIPMDVAQEELGYKNTDLLRVKKTIEQYENALIMADMKRIDMQVDMEIQQQQMDAQAAAMAQQTPQNAMQDSGTQFETMEGVDMRAGGSTAPVAPGATREQIRGTSATGESLA